MIICIEKKTGKVIPDFQSSATAGTLIKNAVNAGLGKAEDFEEREVTKEEYKSEVDAFQLSMKPQRDAEALDRKTTIESAITKLKAVGLTNKALKALFPYAS